MTKEELEKLVERKRHCYDPYGKCIYCGYQNDFNHHKVPPCIEKKIIPLSEALKGVGK